MINLANSMHKNVEQPASSRQQGKPRSKKSARQEGDAIDVSEMSKPDEERVPMMPQMEQMQIEEPPQPHHEWNVQIALGRLTPRLLVLIGIIIGVVVTLIFLAIFLFLFVGNDKEKAAQKGADLVDDKSSATGTTWLSKGSTTSIL